MYISTSLLSVKEENPIKTFYNLEEAKTDYFHIDVMDGKFVEDNTNKRMSEYCNIIKQISNLPLDIHLMVDDVKQYVEEYMNFEPSVITFHYESCKSNSELMEIVKLIKDNNVKAGVAIKPNTPVEKIYEILPYIHFVLVMTVEPGKGGQTLITKTIDKVKQLREYIDENKLDTYIEADGGINVDTIGELKNAGLDIAVVGNGLIKTDNYKETMKQLKN